MDREGAIVTESVVVFGSDRALTGIITRPSTDQFNEPVTAVVFLNAGLVHRVGPNRLYVRLAREMAACGLVSLRFDFSGIGDSPASHDQRPPGERFAAEVQQALDVLADETGASRFILTGICSGAALGYMVARADDRVSAVWLINPPAPNLARRHLRTTLFHPNRWRKLAIAVRGRLRPAPRINRWSYEPKVRHDIPGGLRSLAERNVNVLVLSSEWDSGYDYLQKVLPRKLRGPGVRERVRFEVIRRADHTFHLMNHQDQVVDLLRRCALRELHDHCPAHETRPAGSPPGSGHPGHVQADAYLGEPATPPHILTDPARRDDAAAAADDPSRRVRMESIRRYHSLDGLRASMMLLGLVLHAGASYAAAPAEGAWPFKDRFTDPLFDVALVHIHLFRMPTFFVMAGFFTAFLYGRRGALGLMQNRIRRVLAPLVVFWLALFPLVASGFRFAELGGPGAVPEVTRYVVSGEFLGTANLMHLWFLYDLLIFYAVALCIVPVLRWTPVPLRTWTLETFGRVVRSGWGPLLMAGITIVTLLPSSNPWIGTSLSFRPALRILLAYGVFFTFGWLLFARRELVPAFERRFARHLVLGVVFTAVLVAILYKGLPGGGATTHLAATAAASAAIWLHVYGLVGLFVRYFDRPRPVGRFLADASYWIYLIHVPVIIWTAGVMAPLELPALAKAMIVLGFAVGVCLLSYNYLVRSTVIGVLLNGRRYPRWSHQLGVPGTGTIASRMVGRTEGLERTLVP